MVAPLVCSVALLHRRNGGPSATCGSRFIPNQEEPSDANIDPWRGVGENDFLTRQEEVVVKAHRRISLGRLSNARARRDGRVVMLTDDLGEKERARAPANEMTVGPSPIFTTGLRLPGSRDARCSAVLAHGGLGIVTIGVRCRGRKSRTTNGGIGSSLQARCLGSGACVRSDTVWKVECHFASRVAITRYIEIYISFLKVGIQITDNFMFR